MATTTTTFSQRAPASANTTPSPSKNPAPAARPYKDFLTPALHRRFTHSAAFLTAICWACSSLIALSTGAGPFWSWFPLFSFTGLRTVMLFMPCLSVFIIRVMNMHVGKRTTTCPFETAVLLCSGRYFGRVVGTVFWYGFSAWMFAETYIWSRGAAGGLAWIDVGREYERPRVNENPFYFRGIIITLALWQAMWHVVTDVDRLAVEEVDVVKDEVPDWTTPFRKLSTQLWPAFRNALSTSLVGFVFATVTYFLFFRGTFWPYAFGLANALHRNLLQDKRPPGLLNFSTLAWQCVSSLVMLHMLWKLSNTVFTIYVTQPPLKKNEPLTSEIKDANGTIISKSTDPNGSLIRGLIAKREVPKAFAFWELYLICTHKAFEKRRKTLFAEVDRKPDSTWKQVSQLCLKEIEAISTRIKRSQEPAEYQKQTAETELQRKHTEHLIAQEKAETYALPRIADRKVLDDRDVLVRPRHRDTIHTIGNVAKSLGQSPGAVNPLVPHARKAIQWTEQHTGGPEAWKKTGFEKAHQGRMVQFMQTPLGIPFRQTFVRRVEAVIFGVPHSAKRNIIHAVTSLITLAAVSITEDDYGQVAPTVPAIIRALTKTMVDIRTFVQSLEPSWTDVEFQPAEREKVEEVKEVVGVMQEGLEKVVLAFAEYADVLGITKKELREAREAIAAGKEREMREREV
jgi:nucleoporin NDC1